MEKDKNFVEFIEKTLINGKDRFFVKGVYYDYLDNVKLEEKISYSVSEVEQLLLIQRENCYVGIYNETLDTSLANVCLKSAVPKVTDKKI